MAILLIALSLIDAESKLKGVPDWEVPIPLMWAVDNFGNQKRPEVFVVNLKPIWRVAQLTSANKESIKPIDESNLELWRYLTQTAKIENITPRKAVPITAKSHDYYYSGSYNDQAMCTHAPWYLTVQQHWPEYFGSEPVLFYEVIRTPTMQKPYYEAIVCTMPNIRCKEKTIEALQEQLLQQYSQYLAKMLQDEENFPARQPSMRPNHEWLNGSFIAWLIGVTSEEKKPDAIQKDVVVEQPRSKKLSPAWNNCEGFAFGIEFVF